MYVPKGMKGSLVMEDHQEEASRSPQSLPAEPWLECASTRPRHWGRRRGPPPSPGSLRR